MLDIEIFYQHAWEESIGLSKNIIYQIIRLISKGEKTLETELWTDLDG